MRPRSKVLSIRHDQPRDAMQAATDLRPPLSASVRRHRTYAVIFGHDTRPGRIFDVILIGVILGSVAAIMLESVASIQAEYGPLLRRAEWAVTVVFTLEYVVRLWCVGRPRAHAPASLAGRSLRCG